MKVIDPKKKQKKFANQSTTAKAKSPPAQRR